MPFELANDFGNEGGSGNGARAGVSDLASLEKSSGRQSGELWKESERVEGRLYDIKCSTEGSAGFVLRDLRKDVRPGANPTPGAIVGRIAFCASVASAEVFVGAFGGVLGAVRKKRGLVVGGVFLSRVVRTPGMGECW